MNSNDEEIAIIVSGMTYSQCMALMMTVVLSAVLMCWSMYRYIIRRKGGVK